MDHTPSIFPLGDSAITLDLGHLIDEQLNRIVLAIERRLRDRPFHGIKDIVVAYSSVTIFYDPMEIRGKVRNPEGSIYKYVCGVLMEVYTEVTMDISPAMDGFRAIRRIPVCYGGEFGPDLEEMSRIRQMPPEDIISVHCGTIYRVYMVGFLPGFPYLGKLDTRLQLARKERPVPVAAGGVGIAGHQTGIYPMNSPGGWQIIGRTPIKLFDPAITPPVKFNIGDRVEFYPISEGEFRSCCPE